MVAWPQTVTIPASGHQQLFVPAGFIADSVSVLNPNDGVAYIARDRDCLGTTVGAWDWKVPSQSYAYLPGPFRSVGAFYLDRSGGGLPGELTVYATDVKIPLPEFRAIGRAQLTNVTALDIGQGTIPQNPPANTGRLWLDAQNNLHVLSPSGTDQQEIDTNDALGGDLTGTLPNPSVANGAITSAKIADGTIVNADISASAGIDCAKLGGIFNYGPVTNDWLRVQTLGYGVYNSATGHGIQFVSAGPSFYNGPKANQLIGAIALGYSNAAAVTGSTTSTTFVACPAPFGTTGVGTANLNTAVQPGDVIVLTVHACVYGSASNQFAYLQVYMDGTAFYQSNYFMATSGIVVCAEFTHTVTGIASGAHTWTLYWATNGGTLSFTNGLYSWMDIQVHR